MEYQLCFRQFTNIWIVLECSDLKFGRFVVLGKKKDYVQKGFERLLKLLTFVALKKKKSPNRAQCFLTWNWRTNGRILITYSNTDTTVAFCLCRQITYSDLPTTKQVIYKKDKILTKKQRILHKLWEQFNPHSHLVYPNSAAVSSAPDTETRRHYQGSICGTCDYYSDFSFLEHSKERR